MSTVVDELETFVRVKIKSTELFSVTVELETPTDTVALSLSLIVTVSETVPTEICGSPETLSILTVKLSLDSTMLSLLVETEIVSFKDPAGITTLDGILP